ncbi:MAG: hypothetical protein Q3M24_14795 [Candidatus Electrothrix aestuarii]|uniref:Uncharacterized protein n=1 Tax=Candidatus Electrothrix aestuarii TaxID=3062594 RepID=A0AAU8LRX6_9BACT|nr:hypothetical protein [Candidatus Electrothrix aestuarii]
MNMKYLALLLVLLASLAPMRASSEIKQSNKSNVSTAKYSNTSVREPTINQIKQEIDSLKTIIEIQKQELVHQKKALEAIISKRQANSKTTSFTALGVVIAALIAGIFAFRNQNKQAAQERLLKAIEIIMSSANGYQADIRKRNLAVFLDDATRQHLKDIGNDFSGPEFTSLSLNLAQAMSEKADSPEEVLSIWQSILKGKTAITSVVYPENLKVNQVDTKNAHAK